MAERIKITVVGSGYVGMSLSVLLAQHNDVNVLDIDATRVGKINNKQSTVADTEIELFLAEKSSIPDCYIGQARLPMRVLALLLWQHPLTMIQTQTVLIRAQWMLWLRMPLR